MENVKLATPGKSRTLVGITLTDENLINLTALCTKLGLSKSSVVSLAIARLAESEKIEIPSEVTR